MRERCRLDSRQVVYTKTNSLFQFSACLVILYGMDVLSPQ